MPSLKSWLTITNLFFLLALIILISFGWRFGAGRTKQAHLLSLPDHTVVDWQINGQNLKVEVVNTATNIQRGLSGREGVLAGTDGMMFVFPEATQPSFWMKEMLFSIDLIWLRDGRVVAVEKNLLPSASDAADAELTRYQPPEPINMVLEVPAGSLDL